MPLKRPTHTFQGGKGWTQHDLDGGFATERRDQLTGQRDSISRCLVHLPISRDQFFAMHVKVVLNESALYSQG
jgi:hypothetical protein